MGVFSSDSQSQDSMSKAMDEAKQSQLRGMADLDARIASLQAKIASQEESLEDRILGVGDLLWPLTCGVRIIYLYEWWMANRAMVQHFA